jgi:muramidase (phage lysozyme)
VQESSEVKSQETQAAQERGEALKRVILGIVAVVSLMMVSELRPSQSFFSLGSTAGYNMQPLVMRGGDPYIRALMRTISASEANSPEPYSILYGGQHVYDLSQHPNVCVAIVAGPNVGKCSTAAGRYQMLSSTWDEKAGLYHPRPGNFLLWHGYSFEPEFQDEVVYAWLTDSKAWGVNISALLRQGQLDEVLKLLSGTWTSLGYGIETNSASQDLPAIYQKMLQEELSLSALP